MSTYRTETLSATFTEDYPDACDSQDFLDWDLNAPLVFDLSAVDTLNWTELSESFIAQGWERYLVIGNFNSQATVDTVFVSYTTAPNVFAAYYLDAVSLQDCTNGVGEESNSTLRLWPNPASDSCASIQGRGAMGR